MKTKLNLNFKRGDNVFTYFATMMRTAKRAGWTNAEINQEVDKAKSTGNYNKAIDYLNKP